MTSLEGKVCLITGATSGHGEALAHALAREGADLIIHGRDPEKCRRVQADLARASGREPRLMLCDLSSRAEIDEAAAKLLEAEDRLDVLINNAGGVWPKRSLSPDGLEMTMAVNTLAPFQLTLRLIGLLRRSAPSRVVIIASDAHIIGSMDLDDLFFREAYHFMRAYARSKLALLYLNRELARRLLGTGVTVNAVDPGPVRSNIAGNAPGLFAALANLVIDNLFPPATEACRTAAYVASAPPLEGVTGRYFRFMAEKTPNLDRSDPEVGAKLWQILVEICGVDLEL